MYRTQAYGKNKHQHNRATPSRDKFFRTSGCLMSHPKKDAFGRLWVRRRITALGGKGKYDSKGHPPWHPALGCAIPHHLPIPKESWAEDAVLNCGEGKRD